MRLLRTLNVIFLSFAFDNAPVFACPDGEPIADTLTGKVRGVKQKNVEGDEFCSFKGIPYAKPPVGELRFKDPESPEPWVNILDTMAYVPSCAQVHTITNQILGNEDCLYLNVYTKSIRPKVLRPVMFWIHGGYFIRGNGDDSFYGPEFLMRKDIVLITINYRLGIFGFLNLDDELATGNQGLKDQVMALQWVRDNIAKFGGDPKSVTIFGQSAGGASVHYLAISPLAKNLFHRVISQSGVALNSWAFQTNPKERAFQSCNYLGYTDKDEKSAVEFLKTVDAQTLLKAQRHLLTKDEKVKCLYHFGPSIDSQSRNPFMPVHPEILSAEGIQLPLLIGYNSREGIILYANVAKIYDRFNKEFDELLHPNTVNRMKKYGVTLEKLKHIYFTDDAIKKENIDQLIDLLGDVHFVEGIQQVAKIQTEKSSAPTYLYRFTYDKEKSLMKLVSSADMSGASQTDELFFLFRSKYMEGRKKFPEKGSEPYRIMEQMVEMWVNFATTGVPVPRQSELLPFDWQPVDNRTGLQGLNICENPRIEIVSTLEQKYI